MLAEAETFVIRTVRPVVGLAKPVIVRLVVEASTRTANAVVNPAGDQSFWSAEMLTEVTPERLSAPLSVKLAIVAPDIVGEVALTTRPVPDSPTVAASSAPAV